MYEAVWFPDPLLALTPTSLFFDWAAASFPWYLLHSFGHLSPHFLFWTWRTPVFFAKCNSGDKTGGDLLWLWAAYPKRLAPVMASLPSYLHTFSFCCLASMMSHAQLSHTFHAVQMAALRQSVTVSPGSFNRVSRLLILAASVLICMRFKILVEFFDEQELIWRQTSEKDHLNIE